MVLHSSLGLYNEYINKYLSQLPIHFDGCFSIDLIPNEIFKRKNFILVINTANSTQKVGHFVTLIRKENMCILFDPLAINMYRDYFSFKCGLFLHYLTHPIQSPLSNYCGYYAILFVMYFNFRPNFHLLFIRNLNVNALLQNDRICKYYIEKIENTII